MHRELFVMTLIAALNATAADSQQTYPEGTSFRGETPDRELRLDASQLSKLPTREQLAGGSEMLGPAAPLTYLEVYAVGSSTQGWETLDPNASSTSWDHGGDVMRVAVLEIGYGYVRFAEMNGSLLPFSANYLTETLCWNAYGYLDYCSAGQTVAGYMRYYDVSGHQGGHFTYQNTSANAPGNTEFDDIWIR